MGSGSRSKTSVMVMSVLLMAAAGCNVRHGGTPATLPVHGLNLSDFGSRGVELAVPADRGHKWQARNPRPWRYIVIHHSATSSGSAASFDIIHRRRGWDELGYHFVIDNGRGGPDGRVEVGSRWKSQKHGAHCGGTPDNEYNELGIGICLVGDFTGHMPSEAQLASLRELTFYLMRTYRIPPENVIGHYQAPLAHTACPGGRLQAYVNSTFRAGALASRSK